MKFKVAHYITKNGKYINVATNSAKEKKVFVDIFVKIMRTAHRDQEPLPILIYAGCARLRKVLNSEAIQFRIKIRKKLL